MEVSEFLEKFPEFRAAHEVRVADLLGLLPGTGVHDSNDEEFLSEVFEGVVDGYVEVRNGSRSLVCFHVVAEVPTERAFRQFYVDSVLPERLGNYLVDLELSPEVVVEEQHGLIHAFQMTKNELERTSFTDYDVQFLVRWESGFEQFLDFSHGSVVGDFDFREVLPGESGVVVGTVRTDFVEVVLLEHRVVGELLYVFLSVRVWVEVLDFRFREQHAESLLLLGVVGVHAGFPVGEHAVLFVPGDDFLRCGYPVGFQHFVEPLVGNASVEA